MWRCVDGCGDAWMDVAMRGWMWRCVDGCGDAWMDMAMRGWMLRCEEACGSVLLTPYRTYAYANEGLSNTRNSAL